MNKVSDLTTNAIGKVYRIQNEDGAYIEGTLDAVTFGSVGESKTPEVIVSFKELKTSYQEGTKRNYIRIYTKPQNSAVEIKDEVVEPSSENFGVTRGPGIDGKLFDKPEKPAPPLLKDSRPESWRIE